MESKEERGGVGILRKEGKAWHSHVEVCLLISLCGLCLSVCGVGHQ